MVSTADTEVESEGTSLYQYAAASNNEPNSTGGRSTDERSAQFDLLVRQFDRVVNGLEGLKAVAEKKRAIWSCSKGSNKIAEARATKERLIRLKDLLLND